jgi:hypothetical protein
VIFFESLTGSILKATGSGSARLAGDGTVIEAACSHYNLLKEEAVKARAIAAHQAVERTPENPAAQQEQERSMQCQELFEQRQAARRSNGKNVETLRISGSEPEAMVQRLKRGHGFAASYKPSVLANPDRIITAFAVDPSSETKVVAPMLDQSARTTGDDVRELLLDAGYFDDEVIDATLKRDISLLCPEGQWPAKTKAEGLYHKSAFSYDAHTDTYRCPAGQTLTLVSKCGETPRTRAQSVYAASGCTDCKRRANCTRAVEGRRIKRYPEDEQREALRLVMQQPQARRIFSQRKAIVEPVFSSLRRQQGLDRFRRRGLQGVTREFALHVMAYNLSRAVALLRALFFCLYVAVYVFVQSSCPAEDTVFLSLRRRLRFQRVRKCYFGRMPTFFVWFAHSTTAWPGTDALVKNVLRHPLKRPSFTAQLGKNGYYPRWIVPISVSFRLILLLYFMIHLFIRLILSASITFNRARITCANIRLWRSVLYVLNCINKMLIKWSIFWACFVIHAYLLC